jgi:hypothetical protein
MADFTLYHGDNADDRISFLPTLEKDRLIDMLMYLCADRKSDAIEFLLTFKYEDVVLLRDYLSSVISLFEKQGVSAK